MKTRSLLLIVACCAVQAASPIYVGASYGLYKSVDAGSSWTRVVIPTNTPLLSSSSGAILVESIAIDSKDPSKIYLTGLVGGGQGFFATADAGLTWTATPFVGISPHGLALDSAGGVLYIQAQTGNTGSNFLYRSQDKGATWTRLKIANTATEPAATFPQGSLAVQIITDRTISGTIYVSNGSEFLKSTDFGDSWTFISGPGYKLTSGVTAPQTSQLATYIDPTNNQTWYSAADHHVFTETCPLTNGGICGLFKSTNGGTTWTGLSIPSSYVSAVSYGTTSGVVYAAASVTGLGGTLMKTTDGGDTWTPLKNGLFPADFPTAQVWADPVDPNIVYTDNGSQNGFNVSIDGGLHFTAATLPQGPPGCIPGACLREEVSDVKFAPAALTNKNAGGYASSLAPNMIALAEAANIAPALLVFPGLGWPTVLNGVKIDVADSKGVHRPGLIYYVSPAAVGYLIPNGTALGTAQITLTTSAGATVSAAATVNVISPGLFSADSTGSGAPAGFWVRAANGVQTYDYLFDLTTRLPVPVDLGPATDQVYLSLYGTGFRGFSGQGTATVGGINVPFAGAAAQGTYLGEDVVNIGPLPRTLIGKGTVDVMISFDGVAANTVKVAFK